MRYVYSLRELKALPTLQTGYTDDLKIQNENFRVWLARVTKKDGACYDHQVTVLRYTRNKWITVRTYQAKGGSDDS